MDITMGIILAYYSSAMTYFEQRDGRWYYRPNLWFGGTVIAIFMARAGCKWGTNKRFAKYQHG